MKKVMVINGPNLNLLGSREKEVYGTMTLKDIEEKMQEEAKTLEFSLSFYQSNHEGDLIDKIHATKGKYEAIIINPGAFTHYSYAIRDAISAVEIKTVEVHLSNIHAREEFRKTSVIAPVCVGQVSGFGHISYLMALQAISMIVRATKKVKEG